MGTYKNRPPTLPEIEVRRYMSLWAAVDTLRYQKLRLTLVDYLREVYDPFEGSVPKAEIDQQVLLFSSYWANQSHYQQLAPHFPGMDVSRQVRRDPFEDMKERRLAKVRSTHVSCWTMGDESEGMWRLYCDDGLRGRGVAVQTTLGALESSLSPHDLIVSPVTYRHYHDADKRVFNDELDAFMHKRMGFRHEQELRILRFDADHYHALQPPTMPMPTAEVPKVVPPDLPRYLNLDWHAEDVLERITISPYADEAYERVARDAVTWAASATMRVDKIELSILHPKREGARF